MNRRRCRRPLQRPETAAAISKSNSLYEVPNLLGRILVAGTREEKILSIASVVSIQIAEAPAELRELRDTSSSKTKEMAMIVQFQ